jgi:uncharacterized protein (TIGR03083 family)
VKPGASIQSSELPPILVAHLLPRVEANLLELLRSLSPEDWEKQTVAPAWKVRHVVAHLLDTSLRKLSMARDGYFVSGPKSPAPEDVRAFVDQVNAEGVRVYGRLSPQVLITLIERASQEMCDFTSSLDPYAKATFSVSWAGEAESQNWFETARELTERWHHQQQIRLAVGRDGILTHELYHPVLETFMRALPYSFRDVKAGEGTRLRVAITGECGGEWALIRRGDAWVLSTTAGGNEAARIELPQEIAWRVFTKGIKPLEAKAQSRSSGDATLIERFFDTIAIVG